MPHIKAVLFDLDGTLFDRETALSQLLQQQFTDMSPQLGVVRQPEFVRTVLDLDNHGLRAKSEVYAMVAEALKCDPSLAKSLESDFWTRYHQHCVAIPMAVEKRREIVSVRPRRRIGTAVKVRPARADIARRGKRAFDIAATSPPTRRK